MSDKIFRIASLTCSYNRKDKTVAFLRSLLSQPLPPQYTLDVYLLDDNSSDGTAEAVKANFPSVKLIHGNGSLFWAGGMRKVWGEALKGDYDFYALFNDDVKLDDHALSKLLAAYKLAGSEGHIILGAVKDFNKDKLTYGGRTVTNWRNGNSDSVIPDETRLQAAELGNANIMLVDQKTVKTIGILSESYTHGLADFDYTLTAVKNGIKVWVAPGYYGHCEYDHGKPWLSGKAPLKKRINYLYSPTGLAYKEYVVFLRRHFPRCVTDKVFKLWLKTLLPVVYEKFKKTEQDEV